MAGVEWSHVTSYINNELSKISSDFQSALEIIKISPFDSKITTAIGGDLTSAVNAVALSMVSMFFVMQFCNEAMYLRIKTYEDVFKLIFKFFLAKALVDNAKGLMGLIYNVFNGIALKLSDDSTKIMDGFTSSAIVKKPDSAGFLGFNYIMQMVGATPTLIIIKLACWTISLILIGRLFEIIVYTIIAPIPLATIAGDGWSESSKTFIKGFAAVCLQSVIIIVMFNAFNGISALLTGTHKLTMAVAALSLALGVAKSGQWARTAVGMG